MTQDRNPEQYQAAFGAIAEAVRQMPDDQRREISEQLGRYTHDFKHLLGLVTGANAVLLRSAPADEKSARILEMVEIIEAATLQLDSFIEVLVAKLYLPTRPEQGND